MRQLRRLSATWAAVDLLGQQSDQPLSALQKSAVRTQLAAQKKLIQRQRDQGVRQTGPRL